VSPPMHGYFDVFVGIIQGMVFAMLTMVYWSLAKEHGSHKVDDINLVDENKLNNTMINNHKI
jgi:hypothetical protein